MRKLLSTVCLGLLLLACSKPQVQTLRPTSAQQAMIDRKYGMFLTFGINTYLDKEWSEGTDTAALYTPPADMAQKATQWVQVAKEAGMRSFLLTTKHHDGFCLWDSEWTDHDIANPAIKNKIDIVKAVSDACHEQGIFFSVYYSLWDRHEPLYKDEDKYKYIQFMKAQLGELMTHYGPVGELWFDGAWDRKVEDWYLQEVYDYVKTMQPNCQISTNWTIGKRPVDMQEGDTIVYYPADFRLWDPHLPVANDPKIYTYQGKQYYLPFECTQTISVLGNWYHHALDTTVRDLDELEELFYVSTLNDNCLLLNIPPNTNGEMNPKAVARIKELAAFLAIENGKDFPAKLEKPQSLTTFAQADASSIFAGDTLHWGAAYAIDSDVSTSWKCADSTGWLSISLPQESTFGKLNIIEGYNNIKQFSIEAEKEGTWNLIYEGDALSDDRIQSFMGYGFGEVIFAEPVTTNRLRIHIEKSIEIPAIYSVRLK